jgi:hypothetical protein
VNILTDALPEAVTISNTEYPLHTDFRTCLRIIMAFEDNELTPQEKQIVLLSMLFVNMPPDVEQALVQANWFLNGGSESNAPDAPPMRLYSFAKDANFIFAAFKATHGIDLSTAQLHWWQFLALFMDLGSETTFSQLVALRKRLKTGKASKEEKQAAREMPDLIDVPDVDARTLEEKEAESDFLRKVEQAQQKRKDARG